MPGFNPISASSSRTKFESQCFKPWSSAQSLPLHPLRRRTPFDEFERFDILLVNDLPSAVFALVVNHDNACELALGLQEGQGFWQCKSLRHGPESEP